MNRRELLKAAALPLAHTALSTIAFAQSPYPSRNITMIVPFPPGGQADLAARPVAQALERILGKPVIVDNRAGGGGGSVGNAAAARAVQAMASAPGTLKQQVDDGKMRVLANWGAERVKSFPDLPTFKELGYKDVEFYIWAGLFAQSALPAPIMKQLREAMAQAVNAPEVIKTFETAGSPVAYQDAPEFSKFVAEDSARLVAAVKKIGKVE